MTVATRWRDDSHTLLAADRQASSGQEFTAAGQSLIRTGRPKAAPGNIWARHPATGAQILLNREEEHAFWAWAIVSTGTCGRTFGTPCIHEHACIRCPMLWPDPAQRARLADIRDNLTARIAEACREGWTGEVEGLQISHAGAEDKLAQIDRRAARPATDLGIPQVRT